MFGFSPLFNAREKRLHVNNDDSTFTNHIWDGTGFIFIYLYVLVEDIIGDLVMIMPSIFIFLFFYL